jgi:hypothetical protein
MCDVSCHFALVSGHILVGGWGLASGYIRYRYNPCLGLIGKDSIQD